MRRTHTNMAFALLLAAAYAILASPANATFTVLRSFSNVPADGAYPVGAQLLSGGSLYGFTQYGANGFGSFYKQTTAGAVSTIINFDGTGANVSQPNSGPVTGAIANTFYATCVQGGAHGLGMVFSITTGGTVTSLHDFAGGAADGNSPFAGVTFATDGKLYGVANGGGANNQGVLFSLNPDGTGYAVLHHFNNAAEGEYPATALCEGPDNELYGALYYAHATNGGCIYRCDLGGGNFTVIHGFSNGDATGYFPFSDLRRGPGGSTKLYGTNLSGGANGLGAIYSIDTANGAVALVASFDGYNGALPGPAYASSPQFRMTAAASGTLMYGITMNGGPSGYGTIYKLDTATNTLSLVAGLTQQTGCASPTPLTLSGTSLYGGSYFGGIAAGVNVAGHTDGWGSSFSCTTTGTLKLTHSWFIRDGYNPVSGPTAPISGYMYGTCYNGGLYNWGAIFKISSTTGAYSIIHHLNNYLGEGAYPQAGLFKAGDGAMYGTTTQGGSFGNGTVFKITTAGALTILHHFRGNLEGSVPYQKLVQGAGTDKALYGCLYQGGPSGFGSVFKIDTAGKSFQVLHYFSGADGTNPGNQLTVEPDASGNTKALYGGCQYGGVNNSGTIFKITQNPVAFTKLVDLAAATGSHIYYGGQMPLLNGKLYGTTWDGGTKNNGVIFSIVPIDPASYKVLHNFDNTNWSGAEGYGPVDGIGPIPSGTSDTVFMGQEYGGGKWGSGTMFEYHEDTDGYQVLHHFGGTANGGDPAHPVGCIYDPATGLIFGISNAGGAQNGGAVYSQTTSP